MEWHSKKEKIAVNIGRAIILIAALIGAYICDDEFGRKIFLFVLLVTGIGALGPIFLFSLEKKVPWLYDKRCELKPQKAKQNVATYIFCFITFMTVINLKHMSILWTVIIGLVVGVATAVIEYMFSKKIC